MTVQWFPGHMAKTRRLMKESLHLVDAVCEIVDARIPESSRYPEIDEIVGSKPRIVLLNKCDLADDNATARKIKELAARGITALPVDCRSGKGLDKFQILGKCLGCLIRRANHKSTSCLEPNFLQVKKTFLAVSKAQGVWV